MPNHVWIRLFHWNTKMHFGYLIWSQKGRKRKNRNNRKRRRRKNKSDEYGQSRRQLYNFLWNPRHRTEKRNITTIDMKFTTFKWSCFTVSHSVNWYRLLRESLAWESKLIRFTFLWYFPIDFVCRLFRLQFFSFIFQVTNTNTLGTFADTERSPEKRQKNTEILMS